MIVIKIVTGNSWFWAYLRTRSLLTLSPWSWLSPAPLRAAHAAEAPVLLEVPVDVALSMGCRVEHMEQTSW